MKKKGQPSKDAKLDAMYAKYAAMVPQVNKGADSKKPTKEQKVKNAQRMGQRVEVVAKGTSNKKSEVQNVGKMLNEDFEVKTVPREISLQCQQFRNEKNLTQDQLAKKICENVIEIKNLENGEGAYNPKVVSKIERALNVKFERSWKKSI
ncbi:MAG: helix-turn-helix transcriptional regulator [archaeon]|nr:helix-turn-helix transcriptional regulator [archaeon]